MPIAVEISETITEVEVGEPASFPVQVAGDSSISVVVGEDAETLTVEIAQPVTPVTIQQDAAIIVTPIVQTAPAVTVTEAPDGTSAYEIALAHGFIGTEAEWLASLHGGGGPGGPVAWDDITGKPAIPDQLSDLSDDAAHRTVTDAEKSTWNAKEPAISPGTAGQFWSGPKTWRNYGSAIFADTGDFATAAQGLLAASAIQPAALTTALGGYQPVDVDLSAIALLTTTAFGRSLLTQIDGPAVRATIGAGTSNFDGLFASLTSKPTTLAGYGITDAQPVDADLTAIAALTTTAFGRSLLTQVDGAAVRSTIGAGTSSFSGAFSALTSKPTTLAGYGITDAQPLDSDLTAIAALTTTAFGRGLLTLASSIPDSAISSAATWNGKEPALAAGTSSQYYRGDKSWQTLDKAAVGLGNVENTALSSWAGSQYLSSFGSLDNFAVGSLFGFSSTNTPPDSIETSIIIDGGIGYMFYRSDPSGVRMATANNADFSNWVDQGYVLAGSYGYPYVFKDGSMYYMIVSADATGTSSVYLYSSTNKTSWTIANSGNPIFTPTGVSTDWHREVYNAAAVVVGGTIHFMIEGYNPSISNFYSIGYSSASWPGAINFNTGIQKVITNAGNPSLISVPARNALIVTYSADQGDNYRCRLLMATGLTAANLHLPASWVTSQNFQLSKPNHDYSDPYLCDLTSLGATHNVLLAYNLDQTHGRQAYSNLTLTQLYDSLTVTDTGVNISANAAMFNVRDFRVFQKDGITPAIYKQEDGNILIQPESGKLLNLYGSLFSTGQIECYNFRFKNAANTAGIDIGTLGGPSDPNAYFYQRGNANIVFGVNNATAATLSPTSGLTLVGNITAADAFTSSITVSKSVADFVAKFTNTTTGNTALFNGHLAFYNTFQVDGVSKGDLGTGNALVSGGSVNDFGLFVRSNNNLLLGSNDNTRCVINTAGLKVVAGFGCNGKSPQPAGATGGTLAGVIALLVANGIASS